MLKYKINFEADIELEAVGEIEPHILTNILTMRLEGDDMTDQDALLAGQMARPEVENTLKNILDIDFTLEPVTMDMIEKVQEFDEKTV